MKGGRHGVCLFLIILKRFASNSQTQRLYSLYGIRNCAVLRPENKSQEQRTEYLMKTEAQKKFLIQAAYYILIVMLLYLGVRYCVPIVLPFLLAFIIVWALRRPSRWLAKQLRLPQKGVAMISLVVFYLALFCLIFGLGVQLIAALQAWIPKLPGIYDDQVLPAINTLSNFVERTLSKIDPQIAMTVESSLRELVGSLEQAVKNISGSLMQTASDAILGLPSFMIKLIVMVISSFFLSGDYDKVVHFCVSHLPAKWRAVAQEIPGKLKGSLWIYFRAYALLLCITFAELLLGLLILKIPYAPAIAAAIAVFDLLPVLGTGGILIPWAVIAAVLGYYPMAVGVALLYLFITVVRNTLEPKLIGKQIGLHPLVTLVSLFIGGQLFGIVGLFGLPVALSILVQFRRDRQPEATGREGGKSPEIQR